ncbi:hypothetical protein GOACH_01_01240 [Gordonia aichiensis NBRC 108223]|uniref:Uncharacterized protein n=1 Tax=Gordonia aichiensis NBRC 108223 TaxID=1220583 RepID=L7KD50_9ACTN|nr:hypothetical protein GOACH_01_01240 [Gordonia aichiensis NBRC 108223]
MDKSQVEEAGASGATSTQSRPSGPTPRGGRGIDSATKVISRDQLPDPSTLDDLDDIDPLAGGTTTGEQENTAQESGAEADAGDSDTARTGGGDTDDKPSAVKPTDEKATVAKVAGTASPSATDTTVIKRDDLPDTSDMPDLDDVDITGTADGTEEPADSTTDSDAVEDVEKPADGIARKAAAAGVVATGAAGAAAAAAHDSDEEDTDASVDEDTDASVDEHTDASVEDEGAEEFPAADESSAAEIEDADDTADAVAADQAGAEAEAKAEAEHDEADAESGDAEGEADAEKDGELEKEDAEARLEAFESTTDAGDASIEEAATDGDIGDFEPIDEVDSDEQTDEVGGDADADATADDADEKADEAADPDTADDEPGIDTAENDEEPSDDEPIDGDAETVALKAQKPDVDAPASSGTTDVSDENPAADKSAVGGAAVAGAGAAAAAGAATAATQSSTARPATSTGWSTTAHQPKVIPPAGTAAPTRTEDGTGSSRRLLLVIGAVIVAALVVAGVVWGVLASRAKPAADEAADTASKFSSALYNGDLSTLRSVTCGQENQFYTNISDADFQKIYSAQKARNELVRTGDIKASKVTDDGNKAVVEVTAYQTSKPDEPQTVTINLQKDGSDWKVCTPR